MEALEKIIESEPNITKKDWVPWDGVNYFKERKQFFYSTRGEQLGRGEIRRCELRQVFLKAYNGVII